MNDTESSTFYVARGRYRCALTDDIVGAIEDFTQALRLEPNLAEAYSGRAAVFSWRLEDYDRAIEDYTQAIRLEPSLAEAYSGRAAALSDLGDYAGAIEDYTRAIRLESNNDGNYYCRGEIRELQKDYAGAIEDYTQAIYLQPRDYNYGYRANARLMQDDFGGAIADLRMAIESDEDRWWGWYDKIGIIYASIDDTANALVAFKHALALNPNDEIRKQELYEYIAKNS